jgi:hypothetical protein
VIEGGAVSEFIEGTAVVSAGSTSGGRCLRRSLTPEIRRGKKAGRMLASPVTGYTSTITEITP